MDPLPGLLCVHAHPDDEAIMTGGVLAATAERGLRCGVVTCTGGEAGEVVGEGMDSAAVLPRLAEVRRAELEQALDLLGAGSPRLLGYRDSGMMGTSTNDEPGVFWRADFDEAVGRLVGHLREFRPAVLVTYDAFGNYGHPDHIQSHRVALVAAEAAASAALYPEAGPAWRVAKVYLVSITRTRIHRSAKALAERGLPSPFEEAPSPEDLGMGISDEDVGAVVDVRPWLATKMAALRAHASQLGPDSFFLNVPTDLEELLFGRETFVRHRSDVAVDGIESDLFHGLL